MPRALVCTEDCRDYGNSVFGLVEKLLRSLCRKTFAGKRSARALQLMLFLDAEALVAHVNADLVAASEGHTLSRAIVLFRRYIATFVDI